MWVQGTYHRYLTAILLGLYVKQFIPVTVKMFGWNALMVVWDALMVIMRDTMIFMGIELFILQKFNPVFFERIVETINGWYK